MPLPGDLLTAIITGTFPAGDGGPATGYVEFAPSSDLTDATGNVIIPAVAVRRHVTGGLMDPLTFVRTDNANIQPQGWVLSVTHHISGVPSKQYFVALTGNIDLSVVNPVQPVAAQTPYIRAVGDKMTGTLELDGSQPLKIPAGAVSGYVWTASDNQGDGHWAAASGGLTPPVTIPQGGTGQTTQQAAMDALAGAQAAGRYLRSDGTHTTLTPLQAADVTGALPIANGGTGQTAQQAAINALVGTVGAAGKVLRSDGANVSMSSLAAADVPTLNQNTSGSAASFTGALVGDVTGTQGATAVGRVQGVAITTAEATLVSNLTNATVRSATATLLPGEETVFTGSTAAQTLTLPSAPTSSSLNSVTNTASVSVTLAAGGTDTLNNFGTTGSIVIPAGYSFSVVYIGSTWYVQTAGPSDFALNSALAIANGGTGQTTRQGAMNALAGAQSAGKYLRSDGANTTLSAIAAADLPAGTTAAQGAVQFDSVAADLQPEGVAAISGPSGPSGKTTDSTHVHPLQPWQFSVLKYGATGNLNCVVDAVTNGTAVVTSASGKFTPSMVGMSVAGKGFLTSGQSTLRTTVASYQSATQVTLAAAATSTATGLQMVWGTDDTGAFQAAQNAAVAYGNGSPFSKITQVVIPPAPGGFGYMIDGNLTSTDGTNAVYNGQIVTGIRSDRLPGMILEWFSPVDAGFPRHWNQDYPAFTGCSLFSTLTFSSQAAQATTDTHSIANQGNPAVLSGPTGKNGYGVTATNPLFNNMTIVLTNISIINAHSASGWSICPFNFHGMARAHVRRCGFGTSGVVQYYTGAGGSGGNVDFSNPSTFSGGASMGGLMPGAGNNASNVVEDCVWNGGFTYGPLLTEHTVCRGVNTSLYNWIGVGVAGNYGDGGSGAGSLHAIDLGQFCVESCSYHLGVWGAGAAGIGPYIRGVLDTEGTVQIRGVTNIAANLQALSGELHLTGSPSAPTFTFPTNLRLIKETQVRGAVAAPTITASTAQINTFYRDATVVASGGTGVTAIKVSALAGGAAAPTMTTIYSQASGVLPLVTFTVPAGCWFEIDCTTVPTTNWVLA